MKCKECGVSMHPEQKACLNCGAPTSKMAGGAAALPELELIPQKLIPWKLIGIGGGLLLAAIIAIVVVVSNREVTPDQVTQKWMDAISSRKFKVARQYTVPAFEDSVIGWSCKSEQRSDDVVLFIRDNQADYTVSKPKYDSEKNPKVARVVVTLKGNTDQTMAEYVRLVKQGKNWKIDYADQADWDAQETVEPLEPEIPVAPGSVEQVTPAAPTTLPTPMVPVTPTTPTTPAAPVAPAGQ